MRDFGGFACRRLWLAPGIGERGVDDLIVLSINIYTVLIEGPLAVLEGVHPEGRGGGMIFCLERECKLMQFSSTLFMVFIRSQAVVVYSRVVMC